MRSESIIDPKGESKGCLHECLAYLVAIALTFILCICFGGCKTTQVSEKINVRDSVAIRWHDSIRWQVRDSVNIIEKHVIIKDSTGLTIQFGTGGGTYNAKTGEATNVAGVHQTDTHHEQRDSTAYYRNLASDYQRTADSLSIACQLWQSDYERAEKKSRTSYDRFCSTWFWITAILLLIKVAAWVMEKFPATAPYIMIARKFVPFL